MKILLRTVLLLVAMLMVTSVGLAKDTPALNDFSTLETVISEQLTTQNIPGIAVAIYHAGEVVYENGFGVRDLETNAPVTSQTLFRIGSTSKPLTAIGILQQVEQGNLDLDEPITTYLPEFAIDDAITLRHLLTHMAGISDEAVIYGANDPDALGDYVYGMTSAAQFTETDSVFSYSNPGYSIAGFVLESVSGKPYANVMDEDVFPSLGLNRTTFFPATAITFPVAVGYEATLTGLEAVRPSGDNVSQYPAGFAYSTAPDMLRLAAFLMNDGVLEGESVLESALVQAMKTSQTAAGTFSPGATYGLGLILNPSRWDTPMISHDGVINGFYSSFTMLPEHDFAISILANNGMDANPIMDAAVEAVLALPVQETTNEESAPLRDEQIADYAGVYAQYDLEGNLTIEITLLEKEGQLFASVEGLSLEMRPNGDNLDAYIEGTDELVASINLVTNEEGDAAYMLVGGRAFVKIE